jgi:hypothetical protein
MKYIITEEQNERLEKIIMKFFDKNLTPLEGWESYEDYVSELDENGGELFLQITDDGEWDLDRKNHMWYSICDNNNLSEPLDKGHCPVVTLPIPTFDALNGYFGDKWKKLFRRWFILHTGLFVVQIDSL